MDEDKCGNCKFRMKDDCCHRHPPQVVYDESEGGACPYWSYVEEDDWCGEHKDK